MSKKDEEEPIPSVRFSKLRNGPKGIAIGEEDYFLITEKGRDGKWRVQLYDLVGNRPLTAWVSFYDFEDLRKKKIIKDTLKQHWEGSDQIIERVLIELQGNISKWGESDEEEGQQVPAKEVELLHPAGGLAENFVYEPIGDGEYVYETRDGERAITKVVVEYDDPKEKRGPHWSILVDGEQYYFSKKPLTEWMFSMPNRETVKKWVNGERQSLSTNALWNLNGVFLRVFLDFPHPQEFNATLLAVMESWLTEVLPVVFYLSVKGEFGGGKTVTGEAICLICRHGYFTGNLSPPFVGRTIQEQKLTLMVDELDTVAGTQDSDLNSIFRQGYRRGGKYSRINPETLEPENYGIFGMKLFTVHSEGEEALQTRTLPIHIRETAKKEYPIANLLDKDTFAERVHTENFLWYMDNILKLRDISFEKIEQLDILDQIDPEISGGSLDIFAEKIRNSIYEKRRGLLTEGQVNQVSQVAGRNVELMFLCFAISNLVGVNIDEDIEKIFQQKFEEEGERTEIGYLGILKDLLITLYTEKADNLDYRTESGEIKISNKEIYDRYNECLKKAYGQGVSPAKFKEFMLEFGFTDALNRKKLEVPTLDDPDKKSRLCNIFTERVLRKLGVEQESKKEEAETFIIPSVIAWLKENVDKEQKTLLQPFLAYLKAPKPDGLDLDEKEVNKVLDKLGVEMGLIEVTPTLPQYIRLVK
jgi:hypothetical protein